MDGLTERFQERLNLTHATLTKIEHADAIVAVVYRLTQPDGKQIILKICKLPRHYFREVYCLNYFAEKLPVPRLMGTVAPYNDADGAVLMGCLPGRVGKIADFRGELAFELGKVLGRIHQYTTPGYGELIDQATSQQNAQSFFGLKFEEIIAECAPHLPSALISKCQHYYKTHLDLLEKVDGPCIVHRDFRPGNVIIDKGKIQGIIDWSSAVGSFAEEDFCSMEHGEWSVDSSGKGSFLDGYRSIRPVPNYKRLMPFLRLSKALHIIGFLVKSDTWDNKHSRLYQKNRQFVEGFQWVG